MVEAKENPIVTLKAQAEKFDFSKLRAAEDNKGANSGETMYKDFPRMNFVINRKEIDINFIHAFKEGAKDYKSKLFSKDDIYNLVREKEREIDTEQGRVFVDSVFKDFEKELAQDALHEFWDDHYKNPETTDHQKTDAYKKEFEKFFNAGQEYKHLLPKEGDENQDYRPIAKEIFKEMFQYAGAVVPSDPILEELVTNCNQSGYEAAVLMNVGAKFIQHSFMPGSPERVMKIDCTDQNNVRIRSDLEMPIYIFKSDGKLGGKAFDLSGSLEFTLESQNGKNGVTYKDGKLSLTAPRELENHYAISKEEQLQSDDTVKKSLLDVIIESFLSFIEKFVGTKLKNKQGIYNGIKNTITLNRGNSSEAIVIKDTGCSPIKIECSLESPLKVDSHLESVKPPVHSNGHIHGS